MTDFPKVFSDVAFDTLYDGSVDVNALVEVAANLSLTVIGNNASVLSLRSNQIAHVAGKLFSANGSAITNNFGGNTISIDVQQGGLVQSAGEGFAAISLGVGNGTVTNAVGGSIIATNGVGLSVGGNATQKNDVFNFGRLQGSTVAFDGSVGKETFTNGLQGVIFGDVLLREGDDEFRGASGRVFGTVFAGAGNDILTGGFGTHTLRGDAGNDVLAGEESNDVLDGGTEIDTVNYSAAVRAVAVNLAKKTGRGQGSDVLLNIENAIGSKFKDALTGNTLANRLDGGGSNDTIKGGSGNDVLIGGSGNNSLNGEAGNDVLIGGSGTDTLNGSTGSDTVDYSAATSRVVVNLSTGTAKGTNTGTDKLISIERVIGSNSSDTLTGNTASNVLSGLGGNDNLKGGAGNDVLDGGTNSATRGDTMAGGLGNDTYVVNTAKDKIIELSSQGTDTVKAFANYTLAAASVVERLIGAGPIGLKLTGNGFKNAITGTGFKDTLSGGGGNDTIKGGGDNDSLVGGSGNDFLDGGTNASVLFFADTMVGGSDNDTYVVDSNNDLIVEAAGGGNDTVLVNKGYILPDIIVNVERLVAQDNLNINVAGNKFANVVIGNGGINLLRGNAGNDTLIGNSGNDALFGGAGSDVLNGGIGTDTASYSDATIGAVVVNLATGVAKGAADVGTDTLVSIENLTGTNFNDKLTGNGSNNFLFGLDGNDTISGGGGNDTLQGGFGIGRDVMTGGTGADVFNFFDILDSTVTAPDVITDFAHGVDKIRLESIDADPTTAGNQDFTFIGTTGFGGQKGQLRFQQFNKVGTTNDTTEIQGDTDGNGLIDFKIVLKGLKTLTATDFFL